MRSVAIQRGKPHSSTVRPKSCAAGCRKTAVRRPPSRVSFARTVIRTFGRHLETGDLTVVIRRGNINKRHPTIDKTAEQQLFSQRLLDMFLHHPAKRTCTIGGVIATLGKPVTCFIAETDGHATVGELASSWRMNLSHLADDFRRKTGKGDDRIKTVAEFRREGLRWLHYPRYSWCGQNRWPDG